MRTDKKHYYTPFVALLPVAEPDLIRTSGERDYVIELDEIGI